MELNYVPIHLCILLIADSCQCTTVSAYQVYEACVAIEMFQHLPEAVLDPADKSVSCD